jgi:hypothetical protein
LNPTTLISYERIYLISADNLIRATIDFNIKSMKLLNSREDFFREYEDIVLEIKYPTKIDNFVRKNIESINFRLAKSSKYINYSLFPSNRIK